MATPIRLHVDVLGRLLVFWGVFGLLTGAALVILAAGTRMALWSLPESGPSGLAAVWILAVCGGILSAGGAANLSAGRALERRRSPARVGTLVLSIANLVFVPFGTALGIYAAWVLLNDDARRQFGHTPRSTPAIGSTERT
jgi:hypothetical protein